jgi:hypothetical protein
MPDWQIVLTITPSGLNVQTENLDEDNMIETILTTLKDGLMNLDPASMQRLWNTYQDAINAVNKGE